VSRSGTCTSYGLFVNESNKTRMLRPRLKLWDQDQDQDQLSNNKTTQQKELFCCNTHVWHMQHAFGTVSALIARKNTGAYNISALSLIFTQRLVGNNSVGSKTKSIRPRLRPRPMLQDQDQARGRSETDLVISRSQTPRLLFIGAKLKLVRVECSRSPVQANTCKFTAR